MSQLAMPFFESAEEATHAAIQASGKPLKDVGKALCPEKTPDAARTWLANCLNPNRDERLTADQHIFVANYVRQFHYVHYVCAQTSHAEPELRTPEEEVSVLTDRLFASADELRSVLARVDAIRPRLARKAA